MPPDLPEEEAIKEAEPQPEATVEATGSSPSSDDASSLKDASSSPEIEMTASSTMPVKDELQGEQPQLKTVSFLRQLSCVTKKNFLHIWRRPLYLFFMLSSSAWAVLLAWAAGKDPDQELPPIDDCGVPDAFYILSLPYDEQYNVPLTLNQWWETGLPVACLCLGPMIQAIISFLFVQQEMQSKLLGVLRGLGMRDSVYWASWFIPFSVASGINSLIAALVSLMIPVHVFQSVYFGGIFASFFFLQLALVAASFFLAALIGTKRGFQVWTILIMIVAVWVPMIIALASGSYYTASDAVYAYQYIGSPAGLFWTYSSTTRSSGNYTYNYTTGESTLLGVSQCEIPIMASQYGKWLTEEEQDSITEDDYFLGCSSISGYTNAVWNPSKNKAGLTASFLMPYFHFYTIWSNFLGFTALPGHSFSTEHASMSPEKLSVAGLPGPLNQTKALGTTLLPQGSTIQKSSQYNYQQQTPDSKSCVNPDQGPPELCSYLSTCPYVVEPSPTESPTVNDMLGYLVVVMIIYLLLAAYVGQVLPGSNGAPRPWYFFVQPSYWFGARTTKADMESDSSSSVEEGQVKDGGTGVVVKSLRKTYGNLDAVKSVSLRMERGEVTGLLGHNGAGKSTLSNILSCEIAPSDGDATVFGHSVRNDPYAVRRLVGVCKQDDFLWSDLSAKEHLELFAGMRGVASDELEDIVQKWLQSVDLEHVQFQRSSGFSGGMKRRLSVACATIGGRPFVILDECTTGMDPVSRRFVWRHIDEVRAGRVILLTTHAMEEADLLSDVVAIMRKGELAAMGTPLELKAQHGSALQFAVLVDKSQVASTEAVIQKWFTNYLEWVDVSAGDAGNMTINVHQVQQEGAEGGVDVGVLSDFVAWLESDDSGVSEYGFSNSSLEEVFLAVTKGDEDEVRDEMQNSGCCGGCCSCCTCCACCRPRPLAPIGEPIEDDVEVVPQANTSIHDIAQFSPTLNVRTQVRAYLLHKLERDWTGSASIGNWVLFGLLALGIVVFGFGISTSEDPSVGLMTPVIFMSFFVISLIVPAYTDRSQGMWQLVRSQGFLAASYGLGSSIYSFLVILVTGFVILTLFYATPLFREPEVCDPYDYSTCYYDYGATFGKLRIAYPVTVYSFDGGEFEGQPVTLFATWKAGGYEYILGIIVFFAFTAPGAVLVSSHLPGHKITIVALVFIFLLVSVIPVTLMSRTDDKIPDCIDTIDPANACEASYDIENVTNTFLNCVGYQLYNPANLCLSTAGAILPQFGLYLTLWMTLASEIILTSDPPGYIDSVNGFDVNGLDCSGGICSFPYGQRAYGESLGYMFLGAVILLFMGVGVIVTVAFPTARALRVKHFVTSIFGCLQQKRHHALGKSEKTDDETTQSGKGELDEVIKERETVNDIVKPLLGQTGPPMAAGNDELSHLIAVNHEAIPRDELPPVLMYKLRKVYPSLGGLPPMVALQSLDLHVPKGQVLGLLGKNGAGKTTALKILSTAHDASGGLGTIAGYDVSCEQIAVLERLGTCSQFDIVWPFLSVKHHIEFFARLKGLPRDQVQSCSQAIASAVGLGAPDVYRRRAGALSGGMRRRLSIAISLIGAPSVLLHDEPTTGLDPSTRNNIWGLINSFSTPERSIIITTHMMIEADTLCNRIAIVSRGQLKVVGTQQHLKDKFGSGYLMQINLIHNTKENEEKAMAFVRKYVHPDAVLRTKQTRTLHVQLPREGLDLRTVFRVMYSEASTSEGQINQFLLAQSSLEDVFIALGD